MHIAGVSAEMGSQVAGGDYAVALALALALVGADEEVGVQGEFGWAEE